MWSSYLTQNWESKDWSLTIMATMSSTRKHQSLRLKLWFSGRDRPIWILILQSQITKCTSATFTSKIITISRHSKTRTACSSTLRTRETSKYLTWHTKSSSLGLKKAWINHSSCTSICIKTQRINSKNKTYQLKEKMPSLCHSRTNLWKRVLWSKGIVKISREMIKSSHIAKR